jgi:lipoprotein-anchoring transpeptidase ErfK/SrfK
MWGKRGTSTLVALVAALALTACQGGSSDGATKATTTSSAAAPTSSAAPTTPAGAPVHVTTFEGDGKSYGVGMPVIVYFSKKITDASAFRKAVTVTVNGQKADGAWYFEPSQRDNAALEAHYRLQDYWPGHADIHVNLPLEGLSAGTGLTFDNNVSLDMLTGAAQVSQVDGAADTMTITSDGQPVKTLQVSLGKATTPTYLGTAVVMAKSNPEEMKSDPGEQPAYDIEVPWSVRVTNDGEFIHDAYWNGAIGTQNLSHGCTNLSPADAEWYYGFAQIGDPVTWTNTGTDQVIPVGDGWGDWNLDWPTYAQGGLLPTSGS